MAQIVVGSTVFADSSPPPETWNELVTNPAVAPGSTATVSRIVRKPLRPGQAHDRRSQSAQDERRVR
ncbi:MAG TPA: hypothetical protein VKB03_09215 [Conexibacter sp.]|nr:hypothetical protein [Conexibacter sp.]